MVLPLKKNVIYGPVNSRRLGKSLGINLMPGMKYCSFNCLYCHYGATPEPKHQADPQASFAPVGEVLADVEIALRSDIGFGYLTFSGNGEPTLYPEFKTVVLECKNLLRRIRPDVRLTLLSNSSTCSRPEIIDALEHIDLPIMKLDAGERRLFERINRPAAEIDFEGIIEALSKLNGITIQSLLVSGDPDNSSPEAVSNWYECLRRIKPVAVQIYTLDRPFAKLTAYGPVNIARVSDSRLTEIVEDGRKQHRLNIDRF